MNKILYIMANPKEEQKSYSLQVGRKFIEEYKKLNPQDEVVEFNVYDGNIPLVDYDVLNAWDKLASKINFSELTKNEKTKLTGIDTYTDQFLSANKYVFVTPLWNLSIPPMIKAYIDTIVIAGKTFRYTESGPIGLLKDKKALHIQASGGIYSQGPMAPFEHGSNYLKTICTFMGIESFESILVEGIAYDPSQADTIKSNAIQAAIEMAKRF